MAGGWFGVKLFEAELFEGQGLAGVVGDGGRSGPEGWGGQLGQVVQGVGEVLGAERRELDAPVPDELRPG
jgi:hypothetical protein